MKTTTWWIVVILILVGAWFLWTISEPDENSVSNGSGQRTEIPIETTYVEKVVYTTDMSVATSSLVADCAERGGEFNSCGTTCAPDADLCAEVCAYTCENIPTNSGTGSGTSFNTADREILSDDTYAFILQYPATNWNVEVDESFDFSPKFNLYQKPAGVPIELPLDHQANVTQVSLFPLGVPTEGLFGETRTFDLETTFAVRDDSRVYVLADGTPFAALVYPAEPPENWTDSGFVFVRVRVEDQTTRCLRAGREVTAEECDPLLQDDVIARSGVVDTATWEEAVEILTTLQFGAAAVSRVALSEPQPEAVVGSPLTIRGQAPGPWFFEGQFSVVLTDWDGQIIAEGAVTATDNWMTEDHVPFSGELSFTSPYEPGDQAFMQRGALILQKANPSGLPANAGSVEVSVYFATSTGAFKGGDGPGFN